MQASQSGQRHIGKVAVCGAGVMGAQIAAHCVNAGVPVVLFDLPAKEGDKSAIAKRAIAGLQKMNPAPLGTPGLADAITPANYEDDMHRLAECDLVIEAIAERMDWKLDLYKKLAPFIKPGAIIASNTSGLSITALSQALPEALRHRFSGVHFFNPPRYMPLVELIPTADTTPALVSQLETFLTSQLGKGVVRAKDTPNFIGNRIGVFGILSVFAQAAKASLPVDVVDDLTGTRLGRAKSGTFRTADVVGLDTLAHVIATMRDQLPDDPFHASFGLPAVVSALIEKGALGQKAGAGFYRKEGKAILRVDPAKGGYVPADGKADDAVAALLAERDPGKRLQALRESSHPQAQFVWAVLRDAFHYAAVHLADIADNARQVDQAMVWGFGHAQGPFELWQAAGWRQVAQWVADDIAAGRALSSAPLPDWASSGPVWEAQGVHTAQGSWNPHTQSFQPRSSLPVYQRQVAAPRLVGEATGLSETVVFENEAVKAFTLPAPHPEDVLLLSFKSKMHTLGPDVIQGIVHAVDVAEGSFKALVIGQLTEPFSAGADLKSMLPLFAQGGIKAVEPVERAMQDMVQRVRYAQVPVVAALAGMALGGGCELAVHCAKRVAHFETYMGLVEVGLGLVPGSGGLAYCARRAAELQSETNPDIPLLALLKKFALAVASAQVSKSALDAREIGYMLPSDTVVMNRYELLYVAVREAAMLAQAGWRPPLQQAFPVAGRDAIATLKVQLVNMQVGGFISAHDFTVAEKVAYVMCGGDVDPGSLVDDEWMLSLERQAFLGLLADPKTQERIMGFVKTGKPVRN
ncbi:3-hydroxyacyl-CoA dehydrogenase/enoyl-CoA hydratase family protein [Eoetvoesiella caeni]|uniref:3-hydroxyacyl-CoA dehydrogenase n=1 Tax=Eoetvoesiella caeni TaxID=645616 RepID=A0A366HGN0_9BURK|nr:3-hydroxyacyl-CoA dehydrogenase/enoyl-CoA hydratase family protein [Eoetvoesiella caeni]MCI2807851.1 3-hydroxyacyl-CoA dehydrogenase/enoyl-CoA hydratase family protein [Eoetvoesiella caeni]NYT54147.1 3-hydroxyacyl-CoA dehydrogenase/enoyl-CoA hydratase family protein [Eoetvoesiella caeni]RBP41768.1 3-hydroxyacyl-CoA dehydrogenase [Eoetvoesiella caeni]